MVTFPPCKINLGLFIHSQRADGYHDISTCFYPLPWTDILEILPAASFQFTQSGIPVPGKPEDNLCLKAYRLLEKDFSLPPLQIHPHKIIPMGAGLGAGSSDAAYVLRALDSLFDLRQSQEQLMGWAAKLGSDCAFFIQDHPMLGTGRGELLEPLALSLKGYYLVVITPPLQVSTREAYASVMPQNTNPGIQRILLGPVSGWKNALVNDFEVTVFKKYPLLQTVREKLYRQGAVYASMSGSGSSVFGIFEMEVPVDDEFRGWSGWSGWI